jgi:hypothetical protein
MVVGTDPPQVVELGGAVVFDGNDVVDLEELVVRARLHPAGRVAGLERTAELRRDRALRARHGRDVVAVGDKDAHPGVVQQGAGGRDRRGAHALDLTALSADGMPTSECGAVDADMYLHGLARTFAGQRHERVGCVRRARLAAPGPARVREDAVDVGCPR